MKTLKASILILFISTVAVFQSYAQAPMEDVIYLKNGNVYRGMIIEQVPNTSWKIQTIGGNVFSVTAADVLKLTKENKVQEANSYNHFEPWAMHPWHSGDTSRFHFQPKRKGYFFQMQLLIENLQGGVRIINGYKFHRLAQFGIGIGIDHVFSAPYTRSSYPLAKSAYSGVYLPLYLYYSGDILNKRITPFYVLEGGYAVGFQNTGNMMNGEDGFKNRRSGAMGGIGLGVKINTKRKVSLSILGNMNFKQINYTDRNNYTDVFGNAYSVVEKRKAFLLFPGIRLGLGF